MKINRYEVKCGACGFEYVMFSSDTSEEFMEELKDCPCGNEADVELVEELEVEHGVIQDRCHAQEVRKGRGKKVRRLLPFD